LTDGWTRDSLFADLPQGLSPDSFSDVSSDVSRGTEGFLSQVVRVRMHLIENELKSPFAAANAVYRKRRSIILEVMDEDGLTGFGECVALEGPWYTEETVDTAWRMLERYLIPLVLDDQRPMKSCRDVYERLMPVKGNPMAKAGLDMAMWDLEAKQHGQPLSRYIGGERAEIEAGVAVGIQPSVEQTLSVIERHLEEGYERIKVKISPSADVTILEPIRNRFPDLAIMADANGSYSSAADFERLRLLDEFRLLMIEQPFGDKDWFGHARLQAVLQTPVCLDESIGSAADARLAAGLKCCRAINVKLGRVGGYAEALAIDRLSRHWGMPLWCGGMLESGVGRAHSIALASLASFRYPADISATSRYWERDIVYPPAVVRGGRIAVPEGPGIGVAVDREWMEHLTLRTSEFQLGKL
jgi:O-succinylbenzoate synthase